MDNNVGNEEEKVPVESSGATNKPSKKQAYLDYMRSRMGESYGEDEDSVYSDMLDYRQKNDESQERMTEILSKDPRLAQVLSDMAGGKRGATSALVRYFGKDILGAEEGSDEWNDLQNAEKERMEELESMRKSKEEYDVNIEASLPVLDEFATSRKIDIDEFLDSAYSRILEPIFKGNYTTELLEMLYNAMNYKTDIEESFQSGVVAGRNQKIDRMRKDNAGDGGTATEGHEGLQTQLGGQDASVTTLERGGETGDIIAEDIDEDIAKFRPDFFPIDTVARKAAKKKRKTNYVVKHYNIDASRITCITNAEHTESASKKRVALPIDAADGSVFNVYDTINVRGVDGYASDGSTVTPGVDLMLYVVALDASSGLPVVVAINGKKQNPADVECYVPSIPEGTALYCMAKAGSESQLFCPPTNQAPTPREVYMQRKMSNTKFTEYFENVKKKVAWDKEDVMENDLWEFRRKCEVSYLLGIKGKIAIKDAQYPNRGIENVYFQEGIMWSIKKHYEYTKGKFSFADFIGITKMKFTGNNGSKEAFVGVGKDLLEDMMKVDYTLTKDINVKSREKWGIKFQAFESSFGTMNVVHLPILDEVGLSEIGICLDLDMLVLYKMEEERRNINMETQGEAAERNVTIQTDCLTLKGYSHLLIKPNTSGFNDAEPDLVKAKTNDGATLPSEGNKEGAILYLKKDVASTGTNDELKAGMLAQWNGTKWVKYDGDVYIGA